MYRRLSIRNRMALVLWAVALVPVLVTLGALTAYQRLTLAQRAGRIMEPYANLVSVGADAAVAFEDSDRAQQILDTLRANPQVIAASLELADGRVLAGFPSSDGGALAGAGTRQDGVYLTSGTAGLVRRLHRGARLHLVIDLGELRRSDRQILWLLGGGLLLLLCITIAQLTVLDRTIVRPIATLAEAAERVRTLGDYQQRLPAAGDDEAARLGQSFNAIMQAVIEREADLRRLTAFQRALVDQAPYCIVATTPEGIVTSFNRAAERLTGYTADEVVGRHTPALWHDPLETAERARRLTLELGEHVDAGFGVFVARARRAVPDEAEWTFLRKDGTRTPVTLSLTALRDESGAITGFVGLATDLTERKRAEAALREKTAELDRYFTNALDLLCIADTRGTFRRLNPQWQATLGFSLAELEGRRLLDFLHPDDVEATTAAWAGLEAEGRMLDLVNRYRSRDGSYRWIQWRAFASGGLVYAVAHDITERTHAAELLRGRTAFLEALVDSDLDGVLVVDSAGRKIFQNSRALRLWKVPLEIAGDPDQDAQTQFCASRTRNPQEFLERVKQLYSNTSEISRDEVELVDGTVLDRYSAPVVDRGGTYYGRIWTFRDVTDGRRLEERLHQSQKMEAVGRLAGGIAHDFNNVLAAVQMQCSLLVEQAADSEMKDGLQEILAATERASNLTRQLLTFSRRGVRQPRNLDMAEVVGLVTKLLRRVLGEDIALETRVEPGLPLVHADPGMMEQVLMNLAVNARDAMPSGGRLRVSLARFDVSEARASEHPGVAAGPFVRLDVTDDGCGIPYEHLSRIFEPFFTTKEIGRGTGLGLATVFAIVQQHQGWVEVESEPGKGSTFRVFLPALPASAERHEGRVQARPVAGGTETILFVEDEPLVRELGRRVLQGYGYTVIEAESAAAAIARWDERRAPIHVLLTDLVMPGGMSGRELADEIQRRDPRVRVVYTSGYSDDVVGRQLRLDTGRRFVQKPYSSCDLAAAVRSALDDASIPAVDAANG